MGRLLNRNVAAAEAIQLIGGFSDPGMLKRVAPGFERYAEPDGSFHGAYGARIKYQVMNAITKLQRDPSTRQAVITLWDPWLDNLTDKRDYPCTVMIQFEADSSSDESTLHMNVVMRSNDVWLGLPYDMFQFTQLQLSVANSLRWNPGRYRHTALSMHIYERDVEAAEKIVHNEPTDFTVQPSGIGHVGDSFQTIMKRARILTHTLTDNATKSEVWYLDRLTPAGAGLL